MYPKEEKFPEWMWKNRQFSQLIKSLRDGGYDQVNVFGLDCYSKEESLVELLRFLDVYNPELATRVRYASPEEWPTLLSRLQWDKQTDKATKNSINVPPSRLEQFSAEQNLECMYDTHFLAIASHL
jgi:erythromycin esterase-like protein